MRFFYVTTLVLLTVGVSLPASAEVLQLPDKTAQSGQQAIPMPVRGMNKDQVRAQFGEPREMLPAVGKPPISRWIYDGFTVYFEYSYVIQSVTNR